MGLLHMLFSDMGTISGDKPKGKMLISVPNLFAHAKALLHPSRTLVTIRA